MFDRILRAFRNDVSLYKELKGDALFAAEAWKIFAIFLGGNAILSILLGLKNGILASIIRGIVSAFGTMIGYFILVVLAWFIGIVLAKGAGTFTDLRVALAYAYFIPAVLSPIPVLGVALGLWLLVIASSAIRETLDIGKGLTFFIIIVSLIVIFAISFLQTSIAAAIFIGLS
jgi:hypothetical protein